jgi:pimeloyl-ACP methyl ester carboxylesterase
MLKEQQFESNGVRINFAQTIDTGHPLVLLHGIASEWQSFLPLIPDLTSAFQVFALDLRGHGKSGRAAGAYRLLDYSQDVQHFLETMLEEPAVVYGHSLGAMVAIAAAAQSPQRVRALILGDPPFFLHNTTLKESEWYEPFVEMHQLINNMHTVEEIDGYMAKNYPNMNPQKRLARARTLSNVDPAVIKIQLENGHVQGYDPDSLLWQIACPVLLLQGNPQLGAALRQEDAAYMSARMRNCEIVHMQDTGHGLPAGESLIKVKEFLKSI